MNRNKSMNSNQDADFILNENLTFVTLLQALKMLSGKYHMFLCHPKLFLAEQHLI